MNVIDWLLDSDPAIRWQVMNDLTDASADEVVSERSRVAREGWGAQLLALQGTNGIWRRGDEQPDLTTVRALDLLRLLGADPDDPLVSSAIERIARSRKWLELLPPGYAFHNRPLFDGEEEPCINGRIVSNGVYFGRDVRVVVNRLLGEQMEDGGWNCEQERGSTRGSFSTTINVQEGLLAHEQVAGGSPRETVIRKRGEDYLLDRHLFRRLSTGEVVKPEYLLFSFPPAYHYDVLRGLEYFREAGGAPDARLGEAIDVLRSHRRHDGTWALENPHDDELIISFGEIEGQPSRWNTLRALRVLRWYERHAK